MASSIQAWTAHDAAFQEVTGIATADAMGVSKRHMILNFSGTSKNTAVFRGIVPREYDGSDLTVRISFSMASATSGKVRLDAAFEFVSGDSAANIDKDANSWAANRSVSQTVAGTVGQNAEAEIVFTQAQADGIAAGDVFNLRISRDPAHADDTITTKMQLDTVEVYVA